MNTNTVTLATEAAVEAARLLAEAQAAIVTYGERCAATVAIAEAVDVHKVTRKSLAEKAGVTEMTMGRYYAAGRILRAHEDLPAEAVVAYANDHSKADCKKVEGMSVEDAYATVTGQADDTTDTRGAGAGGKSEEEKDMEAVTRWLSRVRKAGEAGDVARIEALDNALTNAMADAIAEAYAEAGTVVTEADVI